MTPANPQTDHHIDVIAKEKSIAFLNWFIASNWKWYNKDMYLEMFTNETATNQELYDIFLKETQQ